MLILTVVIIFLSVLVILAFIYMFFSKLQLRRVNQQLLKRLQEDTRQPITLQLFNKDLNSLVVNINKCLEAEEVLALESIRKEKRFKEMIANISHDLRTPLTAIKGYQHLIEKGELNDQQRSQLQIAQKHCRDLEKLIELFFEYSYLVTSERELKMERINLTKLLAESLADVVISFEEKGIMVQYEENSGVFVMADMDKLRRIIKNLIANCLEHSAGDVKVSVLADKEAIISFRNPIKSTTEINIERLFERFYTADKSRSSTTGLGLHIVKLLAEQMGGSVSAKIEGNDLEILLAMPLE